MHPNNCYQNSLDVTYWPSRIQNTKAELQSIRSTLQIASDVAFVFYTWHAGIIVQKTCNSLLRVCNFAKRLHAWYVYSSCDCGNVFNDHCGNNTIFAVNFPSSSLMIETADSSATSIISSTLPEVTTQNTARNITTSLTFIWMLSCNFVIFIIYLSCNFVISYHLLRVFPIVTP